MECYQFSAAAGVTEQIEAMLAGGQITEEMKRLVKPALIETDVYKRQRLLFGTLLLSALWCKPVDPVYGVNG